ncbi:sensor histidine kinase [Clostridium sp.]|uniref:sensor histidine kinase n=1 Tax=Clostridium sp. TaxID=1506 RepID=UPI00261F8CC3|nr:sensor histidine kinase [Clostridium sp.]
MEYIKFIARLSCDKILTKNTFNVRGVGNILNKLKKSLISISGFLRKFSLKSRLILSFSIGIILCSSILGVLLYGKATSALKIKAMSYSEQMLSIVGEDIYKNKEFLERASVELSLDENIIEYLINYKFTNIKEKTEFIKYMNNYLSKKLSLLPNLAEVEIISKDYEVVYMQGFKYFKRDEIENHARKAEIKLKWFSSILNDESHICIANPIRHNGNLVGYVFMAIKNEVFKNSFSILNMGEGTESFIIDENNKVIISQNNFHSDFILREKNINKFLTNKELRGSNEEVFINNKRYMVVYKKLKDFEWYITSITPHEFINSDIQSLKREMIIVVSLVVVIVLIFSYFLYISINIPLYKLMNKVKRVSKGDLTVEECDEYNDEIGIISNNFDLMTLRIKKLLDKTKLQEEEKRELEIRMLQAQINPHFLFNTLNSLKWTAIMNQDYTVSEGLSSLAELLRNTIIHKKELITIDEELENIKNYVVIQKIRYGNSFDLIYEVEEDLKKNKVIKFMLQPIVENAIIHGIDENKENQKIIIRVQEKGEDVLIYVIDNGKGFNSEEKVRENKLSGVGWNNVDERIKLTFGNNYGATIKSEIGKGTTVKILIPKGV